MDHDSFEEIKRHFNIVAEGLRSEMRTLAEGLGAVTENVATLATRMENEFVETRAMIRLSYGELERRIVALESRT